MYLSYVTTYIAYLFATMLRQALPITKNSLLEVMPFNEGHGTTYLGMLDTLFLGSYALGSFISGWISDRISAKLLLVVSIFLSIVFCGLIACQIPSLIYFAVFFTMAGLTQSAIWPSCFLLLGMKPRGLTLGVWNTHGNIGAISGKILGAVFLQQWGWPAVFLGLSLLSLTGLIIITILLRYCPIIITNTDITAKISFWHVLWHTPRLLPFSLCFFLVKLTVYTLLGWLPTYLATLGYSNFEASIISAVFDVGSIIGGIVSGFWVDRFGMVEAMISFYALVLTALLLLCYLFFGALTLSGQIILLFFIGSCLNIPYILIAGKITANLSEEHPEAKGAITGIINGFGSLGATIQGIGVGLVGEWTIIFIIINSGIMLAACLLIPMAWREWKNRKNSVVV